MQDASEHEEARDDAHEPEFDTLTLQTNEKRSRYFLAVMSFLLALLCLSASLNHVLMINSMLLELGVLIFGAIGVFFLVRGSAGKHPLYEDQREGSEGDGIEEDTSSDGGETTWASQRKEETERDQTSFEVLVQEALSSLPEKFQERMENVSVGVEYEPGEEVLKRVGVRRGYTLLGLYEGVPFTTYGRGHSSYPESITIYQRPIEEYCHGDPTRIRERVRQTVLHELAHHFGIDHEEMPIWIR